MTGKLYIRADTGLCRYFSYDQTADKLVEDVKRDLVLFWIQPNHLKRSNGFAFGDERMKQNYKVRFF